MTLPDLIHARSRACGVSANRSLFIFSGFDPSGHPLMSIEELGPERAHWVEVWTMPLPDESVTACATPSRIYVFGTRLEDEIMAPYYYDIIRSGECIVLGSAAAGHLPRRMSIMSCLA
eukprot:UN0322